jgi:hypothetical protein
LQPKSRSLTTFRISLEIRYDRVYEPYALRLANFGDVAFTIGDAPTFTVPAAASPAQRVEHAYECRACPGGRQRFNLT